MPELLCTFFSDKRQIAGQRYLVSRRFQSVQKKDGYNVCLYESYLFINRVYYAGWPYQFFLFFLSKYQGIS